VNESKNDQTHRGRLQFLGAGDVTKVKDLTFHLKIREFNSP
jgi:hypothetical protein